MGNMSAFRKSALALALTALALFQAAPALAQTAAPNVAQTAPVAAAPAPIIQQRTATPALWVVKDADTTIYLFGTFHFLPDGLNWNLGPVKTAFESADTLKLEIANLEAEGPAIAAIMATSSRLPEGRRLDDGLNDAQKRKLNAIIAQSTVPPNVIATMRPWVASMVLSISLYQQLGLNPNTGVDKTLDTLARTRPMPVEGFETAAEQIGFFAGLTEVQERALLLATLEDWDMMKVGLDKMVQAWSRGDANRIGTMLSDSMRGQPELARVVLTDRNSRWADWIAGRMATPGTVFVAVGAGHLAGRDSVQAFLRKKGLRATRIANPARN